MSESKHTRGPLVAHKQPDGDIIDHAYSILTHGDECRCVALINLDAGTFADLQLWASAPDLLERVEEDTKAFEQLHAYLTTHAEKLPPFSLSTLEVLIAKNRAAAAKAEGRDE